MSLEEDQDEDGEGEEPGGRKDSQSWVWRNQGRLAS